MSLKVIGIVGLHGSGKTEVAKALAELGVPTVRMGDVVLDELRRHGKKINEASVARVANELRKREGLGAIAKRCIPIIKARGRGKSAVTVDGIRGIAEVEVFRRAFGDDFHLIAVWASERTRFKRVTSRAREDDVANMKRFRKKDLRELGWGLADAFMLADYMVVNEGAIEETHSRAVEIFKSITGGKP